MEMFIFCLDTLLLVPSLLSHTDPSSTHKDPPTPQQDFFYILNVLKDHIMKIVHQI